jgi:hypothetical protein
MKLRLLLLSLLCPIIALAQSGTITGKVIEADTKAPVRASVFLASSSFGTTAADNGIFTLSGIKPGQYTLVVNAIGYQDHTQTVMVTSEPVSLTIELAHKTIELKEVTISTLSKADWNSCFAQFKEKFIGTDKNAGDCKIINPDVLNFSYHKAKKELDASTDDFLIVENKALGYRVKFLIQEFKSDGITQTTSYVGQPLFEELTGSESQKKKWRNKRREAYYGSSRHFYRSLLKDSLVADGFEIYPLTRQLIPKPTPAPLKPNQENVREISAHSIYTDEKLGSKWKRTDILNTTNQPGIYAITFPNCLYVVYKNKRVDGYPRDVYHPNDMPNYEVTIVSLSNKPPYALFDTNGSLLNDPPPLYEGTWAMSRLSMLLPVDYEPGK